MARRTHEGLYHGQAPTGRYHWVYDYVADVQPDSGAPAFRATFTELFNDDESHLRRPDVGERARVKFHENSHKVKFDRTALREDAQASTSAARQDFNALASAGPGSPPPVDEQRSDAGTFAGQAAEFARDASAFREQSAEFRQRADVIAAMGRAKTSGDRAEVERLKAVLLQPGGETIQHPAQAGPEVPSGQSAQLDRLARLADLRDRGVLTDDEFAAEKAKVLRDN